MKTTIYILACMLLCSILCGIPHESSAALLSAGTTDKKTGWTNFGGNITLKRSTSLVKILDNVKRFEKKEVLVDGTISEVCQNKGCWMVVASGRASIRVEFKDYGFFVPWDADGKKVRLQGALVRKTVSEKALKHMAGEMKNPPVEAGKIGGEETITVFVASAVAIQGDLEIGSEQQEIIDGKKSREGHEDEDHDHEDHDH